VTYERIVCSAGEEEGQQRKGIYTETGVVNVI
jgi:hypothetical protein